MFDRVQGRIAADVALTDGKTPAGLDFVSQLFRGETETQLKCVHVCRTSARREGFLDIQLDIKNSAPSGARAVNSSGDTVWSLQAALEQYTAVEQVRRLYRHLGLC